ncbi:hypothetical protein ACCO45_003839 [Purpureocillium lilacinum]|uniref:Uncharacterized protein n=1 Tax=Purpureocillium lilacinum TaxID=33203 RepID=A0ACC4E1F9_PURLI
MTAKNTASRTNGINPASSPSRTLYEELDRIYSPFHAAEAPRPHTLPSCNAPPSSVQESWSAPTARERHPGSGVTTRGKTNNGMQQGSSGSSLPKAKQRAMASLGRAPASASVTTNGERETGHTADGALGTSLAASGRTGSEGTATRAAALQTLANRARGLKGA